MSSWLFQANPKFYKVRAALHHFKETSQPTTWLVNAHKSEMRAGDEVFFWEAGPEAGLVGWGRISADPEKIPLGPEEFQFVLVKAKFDGDRLRVRITVEGECYWSRRELGGEAPFSTWNPVARGVEGTNFLIPEEILPELRRAVRNTREGSSSL